MSRITWVPTPAGQRGIVKGEHKGYESAAELFTIYRTTDQAAVRGGTPYELEHKLPFRRITRLFPSPEAAKAHAEKYLVGAMELLGFVPKGD